MLYSSSIISQIVHTVKKNESLWSISKKYFGNGEHYITIWQASKTEGLTRSPNLIYPDMLLNIDTAIKRQSIQTNTISDYLSGKIDTVIIRLDTSISIIKNIVSIKKLIEDGPGPEEMFFGWFFFPLIVGLLSGLGMYFLERAL